MKETDFGRLKIGARATITVDAYPSLEFQGEILRLGKAATSEFALLPSPNPSGNFTKITQRLPVRISIDQTRRPAAARHDGRGRDRCRRLRTLFARYGPAYRWLATGTAMIAAIAVMLSTTIVNVAIPDVMGAFGISQVQAQWLSTGFLAAMTATMLLTDWADKRLRPARAPSIGAAVLFMVGSVLGGVAPERERADHRARDPGRGGGHRAAARDDHCCSRCSRRTSAAAAMGIFGIGVVLAPALGPWIGGMLIDSFNWRYVFYPGRSVRGAGHRAGEPVPAHARAARARVRASTGSASSCSASSSRRCSTA